jgi:hypothetical protein
MVAHPRLLRTRMTILSMQEICPTRRDCGDTRTVLAVSFHLPGALEHFRWYGDLASLILILQLPGLWAGPPVPSSLPHDVFA